MKYVTPILSIIFFILSNTTLSLAQQNQETLVSIDSLKKTNKEELISKIKKISPKQQLYIVSLSSTYIAIGGLFTFSAILLYSFKRHKRKWNKMSNASLSQELVESVPEETKHLSIISANPDIRQQIIDDIQKKLKQFENDLGFLSKECNLNKVATDFGTNVRYLSKIINAEKGVSFPVYINELRINYAIAKLKTNKKFRFYSIKAIAETVGFNTAETFSKAFFIKTGIQPSYFIKELEKKNSSLSNC